MGCSQQAKSRPPSQPRGDYIYISDVSFSPDGTLLATAGDFGIRLWDVATGRRGHHSQQMRAWGSSLSYFSPDGALLAVGSKSAMSELWDVASRRKMPPPSRIRAWVSDRYRFLPTGPFWPSGSSDGKGFALWDVSEWTVEQTITTVEAGHAPYLDESLRRWTRRHGRRAIGQAIRRFRIRSRTGRPLPGRSSAFRSPLAGGRCRPPPPPPMPTAEPKAR